MNEETTIISNGKKEMTFTASAEKGGGKGETFATYEEAKARAEEIRQARGLATTYVQAWAGPVMWREYPIAGKCKWTLTALSHNKHGEEADRETRGTFDTYEEAKEAAIKTFEAEGMAALFIQKRSATGEALKEYPIRASKGLSERRKAAIIDRYRDQCGENAEIMAEAEIREAEEKLRERNERRKAARKAKGRI